MKRYRIHLDKIHKQSGLTPYKVGKALGLNQNTVHKYLTECVEADYLSIYVVLLADFYGVDWRDPAIVEVVDAKDAPDNPLAESLLDAIPA